MTVGDRIKEARLKSGLTQKQLSEKCNLNVNSISMYERNNIRPRFDVLERIGAALNIQVSQLLGFESSEEMKRQLTLEIKKDLKEIERYYGKDFVGFLQNHDSLNASGQKMVYAYTELLTKMQDYQKHPSADSPKLDTPTNNQNEE